MRFHFLHQRKTIQDSTLLQAIAAVTLLALLMACGGNSTTSQAPPPSDPPVVPTSPTLVDRYYAGPGSRWDVALLASGAFTIERRATATSPVILTVEGTYEQLTSGFLTFTVTAASGMDAPAVGSGAWALEVPGVALFLRPEPALDRGFISLLEAGECPTDTFDSNWVMARPGASIDANDLNEPLLGSFSFDPATGESRLDERYSLNNFNPLGELDLGTGSCSDGLLVNDAAAVYLTSNGGGLVKTFNPDPAETSIVLAMPSASVTGIDALDGSFIGVLSDNVTSAGVAPISVACSAGLCTGDVLTAVDDATIVSSFEIDLFGTLDFPVSGFVSGEFRADGNRGAVACQVVPAATPGERLATCVAQDPADNDDMLSLLLRAI
ncbi:MAG: hypothetical protein AAF515_17740 [Pseudomonadota bacterium]